MGYIFENLIGRFYQNTGAGQFYTGRDIIKMMVSILTAEGSDDIFDDGKVITILDQASGTGGMLSTAENYLSFLNPSADIRLFSQEIMASSYAVGLAEMLIKGHDAENFKNADTLIHDCFENMTMRYVLENPPFGTPWNGKNAKAGQGMAVLQEHAKGENGRFPAGLPSIDDSLLLFMQSAIKKMDKENGRAAIISDGSALFAGGTASGESQIRRWMLEKDIIEAIIAMPSEFFYNTTIPTYVWIFSNNKRKERKGKVQLIDATEIYHPLRKSLGKKRREFTKSDREKILELYADFKECENSKIFDNEDFIYREYSIYQPLQRSYMITAERIEKLLNSNKLNIFYNESKYFDLLKKESSNQKLEPFEKKMIKKYTANKEKFEEIINTLKNNVTNKKYLSKAEFLPFLSKILKNIQFNEKLIDKIADGLSFMDKEANIVKTKNGKIKYDKDSKDTENINIKTNIDDYMKNEVLPYLPDAVAFFEEDLKCKKPKIKTGAQIPFTRFFYKYETIHLVEKLETDFMKLESSIEKHISRLFEVNKNE